MNNARLFNESIIEAVRLTLYTHQTSRMRGIFFFRTREDAEARIGDDKWPPYFEAKNLLELELRYDDPFTDVDANWITFAPVRPDGRVPLTDLQWMQRYWAGEQYNDTPVWERIAKGVAVVLDEQVRKQCYDYLRDFFPHSHIPILMARLASEAGTRGGLVSPFLLRLDEKRVQLGYLWTDADFHDPQAIEAMSKHADFRVLGEMMAENETWKMIDLRLWGRVFELSDEPIPGLKPLPSLHHPK
jgi:hypothetical protein